MPQQISLVIKRLKEFLNVKLNNLVASNPQIAFLKPFATRYIDNKLYKIEDFLYNFSDKEGNIDIENILKESIDNVVSAQNVEWKLSETEKLVIDKGAIKIDLPFINKQLVFSSKDIEDLKNMF